jgi:ABC-type amino acid transport system permease subunit
MSAGLTIYVTLLASLGGCILGATIADPRFATDGLRGLWDAYVRMFRAVRAVVRHR